MEKESEVYQFPEMNLIAGCGAEKIIQKIYNSSLGSRLLLKNDKYLNKEWYRENLVNYLEFFSPEEGFADTVKELEGLFFMEASEWEQENDPEKSQEKLQSDLEKKQEELQSDLGQRQEELQSDLGQRQEELQSDLNQKQGELQVVLYQKQETIWQIGDKNPRVHLKIMEWPFQIPFELELIPYAGKAVQVKEKELESRFSEENITYCMFSEEEYLSRSFYKMLEHLELINLMSWYKESYDILTGQMVSGRRVSESFGQLLLDNNIPLLKERLDIVDSFKNYRYMEKRWKNYMSRFFPEQTRTQDKPQSVLEPLSENPMYLHMLEKEEIDGNLQEEIREDESDCPEWSQVIELLVRFFTPIFDMVLRNELFIGDWMPQIGRYLD